VERFVTEETAQRGVDVIPAQELRVAFAARGETGPPELKTSMDTAHRKFGATSLLRGRVRRYRERGGQDVGRETPASVAFDLTLYSVPDGKRLWTATFDETQVDVAAAPGRARRYPGGGTRWLTAAELARWGAGQAADTLVGSR
jgi:hypothetical protein